VKCEWTRISRTVYVPGMTSSSVSYLASIWKSLAKECESLNRAPVCAILRIREGSCKRPWCVVHSVVVHRHHRSAAASTDGVLCRLCHFSLPTLFQGFSTTNDDVNVNSKSPFIQSTSLSLSLSLQALTTTLLLFAFKSVARGGTTNGLTRTYTNEKSSGQEVFSRVANI